MNLPRLFALVLAMTLFCWRPILGSAEEPRNGQSAQTEQKQGSARISYYRQIRPIFQANCWGCHQPANPRGKYVMTEYDKLLAGGESGLKAIVPGNPDESNLVDMITPLGETAEMPKGKPPLKPIQIEWIRQWIAQGAQDDTPPEEKIRYDMDHPPVYTQPPIVTSLDFSPDGTRLAISGHHEVFVYRLKRAEGNPKSVEVELESRLVGMSPRIQKVAFSPDGKRLAVAAGKPARFGEIQIWDVEQKKLLLSAPVSYDTVYGVSWSPDAKLVAFGCADRTVRAIETATGKEVLYQGAHEDWVLDTVFSSDGSHLVSVSRDMSAKLTEVATQRFIDNITSITPGALKGGIQSVVRHPAGDHILVGGSDGMPKLYRIFRQTVRVIGDDGNLIRQFPALEGRIFAVDVSPDGKRAVAAGSLDARGEIVIYEFSFERDIPDEIKQISQKTVMSRTPEENQKLEEYHKKDVRVVARTFIESAGMYAVAFDTTGTMVAVGGADGLVRFVDADSGQILKSFSPVPQQAILSGTEVAQQQQAIDAVAQAITEARSEVLKGEEPLPSPGEVEALEVMPTESTLTFRFDTIQFVVMARTRSGQLVDVTRAVEARVDGALAEVSPSGALRARADGKAVVTFTYGDHSVQATVDVQAVGPDYHVDFVRDVMPVLSKAGCNAGTCHGAAKGKAGFKLSLRGNDPVLDYRSLTDDLAGRRINLAAPADSLMLLKPTAEAPHEGGQVLRPGSPDYETIRRWIAQGAKFDPKSQRVVRLEIYPKDPIIHRVGGRQQFRVVATYPDGSQRDVTEKAFVESGDTEVAAATGQALLTALRRGESPVLARYEGTYAHTTLTVLGDRENFAWNNPPVYNFIDELVDRKLQRTKTLPSNLCTDEQFIRRVYLDLTGLPPSPDEVRKFLEDPRPSKEKRDALVDDLLGSDKFVEYWTNKWADLLQVNRKYLGVEGAKAFRDWIREQIQKNRPYNEFVYELLTASGSNKDRPSASYFKIHREPAALVETTTHLFLGIRFNCNKCHDHPFERWNQRQYYETAAFFSKVVLKPDPASGDRKVGGTDVEAPKPLFEIVEDGAEGVVYYEGTRKVAEPKFPFECRFEAKEGATLREQFARWLTSPDNPYFARSFVNRIWGYLLGRGFIEPLDDIRAGNPPTNPELLDRLTEEFIRSGWNVQHLMRLICTSRTYQLSSETNPWNEDDKLNYSHYIPKRLPAEALFDAIHAVTGAVPRIPGAEPGVRAAALLDPELRDPTGFLDKFGRPPRESPCECERSTGLELGAVLALVSGEVVENAITDPNNAIAKLVQSEPDDTRLVEALFLRVLNRKPTSEELHHCLQYLNSLPEEHQRLVAELKQYEQELAPKIAQQEAERQQRIAQAQAELKQYQDRIAPKVAELERHRAERIAAAEAALNAYMGRLPESVAAWLSRESKNTAWVVVEPTKLESDGSPQLVKEADGVIFSTGQNGNGSYKVTAETELKGVTAVRLEALTDPRLPQKGPGRAGDGNFVVTEFEVWVAPKAHPDQKQKVQLVHARADFSQQNYSVESAVDGQVLPANNGWAVAPKVGADHVAVFEFAEPVGFEGGTMVTFVLNQSFESGQHTLGKFRLSLTTTSSPVLLGPLPDEIVKLLEKPADQRTPEELQKLTDFYRDNDVEYHRLQRAVELARQPLPVDPQLKALQDKLAEAQKPLPVDPKLAQLRRAVELSERDLQQRRLSAAQDITWALINTPEFLFNH